MVQLAIQSWIDRIFRFAVSNDLSAIGKPEYTIDSNADWIGTVLQHSVCDTTNEDFTIRIDAKKDLPKTAPLAIKVNDVVGNTHL
jgi:hypothetical protein